MEYPKPWPPSKRAEDLLRNPFLPDESALQELRNKFEPMRALMVRLAKETR